MLASEGLSKGNHIMDLLSLFDGQDDRRSVAAGEAVFSEGDPGDTMFVVLDGSVELRSGGAAMATVGPGELFGEMSLIDDEPRSLDAVATTDSVLAELDERRFLFLVNETPMFALHVMGVMADRLRSA